MRAKVLTKNPKLNFILVAFGVFGFNLYLAVRNWSPLQSAGLKGVTKYEDFKSVLESAHCYLKMGNLVYHPTKVEPQCFYAYGHPLLQVINLFGVSLNQLDFIGNLFWVSTCAVLLIAIYRQNESKLFKSILVCSPGIWLLFERANIDSMIFLLICLAIFFWDRKNYYMSGLVIFASAIFKFYTFPLLIILTISLPRGRKKSPLLGLASVAFFSIFTDVTKLHNLPNTWFVSFGAPYPGLLFNLLLKHLNHPKMQISYPLALMSGITIFSILLYFQYRNRNLKILKEFSTRTNGKHASNGALVFGLIHLTCFVLGMNYDYRLVFEIAFLLSTNFRYYELKFSRAIKIVAILAIWFNCFAFGKPASSTLGVLIQGIGAGSQLILTSWIFWVVAFQGKQLFELAKKK